MSLLVRKIEIAKWLQTDIHHGEDISADAITNCMRTTGNTLSVWEIKYETDIDEAVLAIVAGGHHLETIDIVTIDPDYIEEKNIGWLSTEGLTPVDDLKNTHRDLYNLTYCKLGVIAYHIAERIIQNKVQRYTLGRLKQILKNAVGQGRLEPNTLSDSLRKRLV